MPSNLLALNCTRTPDIWGATVLKYNPDTEDFEVMNVMIACDDSQQTWFHTLNCQKITNQMVKQEWPEITEHTLQSDGASNYTCTALMSVIAPTMLSTGIRIVEHTISEVTGTARPVNSHFCGFELARNPLAQSPPPHDI